MNTAEVIREVIQRNPEIASIRFFRYNASVKLQERASDQSESDKALVELAIDEKLRLKIGFWDSLLRVLVSESNPSSALIRHALFHNRNSGYKEFSPKGDFESLQSNSVAVNSRVVMADGSTRHIPMLDFELPGSDECVPIALRVARALKLYGYLLDSGQSFHFVGLDLIDEDELLTMLGRFILLSPIADKAWAAHQIIERSCSLRIGPKSGRLPTVVASTGRN